MTTSHTARDGELVALDQATVFVRVTGAGAPLLLINGLGAHTGMWRSLERELDGFEVVQFDLPGAGRSPAPRRAVSIPDLSALSVAVLDHVGIDRADVLGYSMGGMVAQQLAATYPQRVRRLVLAATTPGVGSVHGDPRALINIVTPARYLSQRLYASSIGSMVGGRARHDTAFVAEQARVRLQHRPSWRGYLLKLRSIARWSALPLLASIDAPTLILAGADDPLTPPANAMILGHSVREARVRIFDGQGHLLMVDESSAALPAVRDFLVADRHQDSAIWQESAHIDVDAVRAALAAAPTQLPPRCLRDAHARRRWLRLDRDRAA